MNHFDWGQPYPRQQRDVDPKPPSDFTQRTDAVSEGKWDIDPHEWERAHGQQQRHLDPEQWSGIHEKTSQVSRTGWDTDVSCGYTLEKSPTGIGTDVGREHHIPSPHNRHRNEYAAFDSDGNTDPDGQPIEMSEEDEELVRKRRQLQMIEEQILLKKAAIAMKKIEPFLKNKMPYETFPAEKEEGFAPDMSVENNKPPVQLEAGCSYSKQSAACKAATLKDRVNVILQQKRRYLPTDHAPHSLSTNLAGNFTERMNSSSRSREDHPLKLRVNTLMRQRRGNASVLPSNGEVPDVKPPSHSQRPTSAALRKNAESEGFQRFLNILNKGVDINLLTRIVNDDSEELPDAGKLLNIQPPVAHNKSDVPYRSESQGSSRGALEQDQSRSKSRERKSEPPSQRTSSTETQSLREEESIVRSEKQDSHETTRSPPRLEDQQRQQLQNILKTLGLSLEAEEISKLSDRTQERLYGKKHDVKQHGDRERERRQKSIPRHHENSSSSSSISGSLSPSHRRRSCSTDSDSRDSKERRRTLECRQSRESGIDTATPQGPVMNTEQAPRHRDIDKDRISSWGSVPGHHPYPANPAYPPPQPAAQAALQQYSSAQHSHYTAHHSSTYNAATNSAWFYTHGAVPAPSAPSGYFYQQNTSYNYFGSEGTPNMAYPYAPPRDSHSLEDTHLLLNPDLSASEGQSGQQLGRHCLKVIPLKQRRSQGSLKPLTNFQKRRSKKKKRKRKKHANEAAATAVAITEAPITTASTTSASTTSASTTSASTTSASTTSASTMSASTAAASTMAAASKAPATKQVTKSQVKPGVPKPAVSAATEKQHSEDKKQLTEEEIKANLKKKLDAFNQLMKQKGIISAKNSLT